MEDNKKKYGCEKCKYFTNEKSGWGNHINSGLHLNGYRAIRCDKKIHDKCPYCEYITKNNKFTWSLENDKKLGKVLADKAKNWVKYVFVLAENEAKNNMILLKNLEKNTQETIYFK